MTREERKSKLHIWMKCNVTDLCRFYDAESGEVSDIVILDRVNRILDSGVKDDTVLYLRALFAAVAELEGGDLE